MWLLVLGIILAAFYFVAVVFIAVDAEPLKNHGMKLVIATFFVFVPAVMALIEGLKTFLFDEIADLLEKNSAARAQKISEEYPAPDPAAGPQESPGTSPGETK